MNEREEPPQQRHVTATGRCIYFLHVRIAYMHVYINFISNTHTHTHSYICKLRSAVSFSMLKVMHVNIQNKQIYLRMSFGGGVEERVVSDGRIHTKDTSILVCLCTFVCLCDMEIASRSILRSIKTNMTRLLAFVQRK